MLICPNHIKYYIKELPKENIISFQKNNDFNFGYQIICTCGNNKFQVFNNEEPKLQVECSHCHKNIIIYDLDLYPCSSKYQELPLVQYTSPKKDILFEVYVIYEYSDEFELEDEEFDCNGISWCDIYLFEEESNEVFHIISDETS